MLFNSWEFLESLIVLLKSKKITPILITTPNYKGYRDGLIDKTPFHEYDSISSYLTTKYGIYHLNYFDDDSFKMADFHNLNHLNKYGAEKLTQKIDTFITFGVAN